VITALHNQSVTSQTARPATLQSRRLMDSERRRLVDSIAQDQMVLRDQFAKAMSKTTRPTPAMQPSPTARNTPEYPLPGSTLLIMR